MVDLEQINFKWNVDAIEFIPQECTTSIEPAEVLLSKNLSRRNDNPNRHLRKKNRFTSAKGSKIGKSASRTSLGRRNDQKREGREHDNQTQNENHVTKHELEMDKNFPSMFTVSDERGKTTTAAPFRNQSKTLSFKTAILSKEETIIIRGKAESFPLKDAPSSPLFTVIEEDPVLLSKQRVKVTNRVAKVPEQAIEKHKMKWLKISDEIVKNGLRTDSNSGSNLKEDEKKHSAHIWHGILRAGQQPVKNHELHRSANPTATIYSVAATPSMKLSDAAIEKLIASLSWWDVIFHGLSDIILPYSKRNPTCWEERFHRSSCNFLSSDCFPAHILEQCEELTCLQILCILSSLTAPNTTEYWQHLTVAFERSFQSEVLLSNRERCHQYADCLGKLLQSSFMIQDSINHADNPEKKTPLHFCCQFNNVEALRIITSPMFKTSLHVNLKDIDGNTPLHLVLLNQHYSLLSLLLEKFGPSIKSSVNTNQRKDILKINQRNKNGCPAIMYCFHRPSLLLLLDYGASPFLLNEQQYDTIMTMISRNEYLLVKTLLTYNYTIRQIQTFSLFNTNSSSAGHGTLPRGCEGSGTTPFHLAIETENEKLLHLLFINIDLSHSNYYFYDYLLCSLNLPDQRQSLTAIQYATMTGKEQIFRLFLLHPLCEIGREISNTISSSSSSNPAITTSHPHHHSHHHPHHLLHNEIGLMCYYSHYRLLRKLIRSIKEYYFHQYYHHEEQEQGEEKDQERSRTSKPSKKKAIISNTIPKYHHKVTPLSNDVMKGCDILPRRNYLQLFTLSATSLQSSSSSSSSSNERSTAVNLIDKVTIALCLKHKFSYSRYYLAPRSRTQKEIEVELDNLSRLYEENSFGLLCLILGGANISKEFLRFFLLSGNLLDPDAPDEQLLQREEIRNKFATYQLYQRYGLLNEGCLTNDFSLFYESNGTRCRDHAWRLVDLLPTIRLDLAIQPDLRFGALLQTGEGISPSSEKSHHVKLLFNDDNHEMLLPLHLLTAKSFRVQYLYRTHVLINGAKEMFSLSLACYSSSFFSHLLQYVQYGVNMFESFRFIHDLREEKVDYLISYLLLILQFAKEYWMIELELFWINFFLEAFFYEAIGKSRSSMIYVNSSDVLLFQNKLVAALRQLKEKHADQRIVMRSGSYRVLLSEGKVDETMENTASIEYHWLAYEDLLNLFDRAQRKTISIARERQIISTNNCLSNWMAVIEDGFNGDQMNHRPHCIERIVTLATHTISNENNYYEIKIESSLLSFEAILTSLDMNNVNEMIIIDHLSVDQIGSLLRIFTLEELNVMFRPQKIAETNPSENKGNTSDCVVSCYRDGVPMTDLALAQVCCSMGSPSFDFSEKSLRFNVVVEDSQFAARNRGRLTEYNLNEYHYYLVLKGLSLFPNPRFLSKQSPSSSSTDEGIAAQSHRQTELLQNIRDFFTFFTQRSFFYSISRHRTADMRLIVKCSLPTHNTVTFPAHSEILCSQSGKFAAMKSFQSSQQDQTRLYHERLSHGPSITMINETACFYLMIEEPIEETIIEAVLFFCYHGFLPFHRLRKELSLAFLLKIARFAEEFLMSELLQHSTALLLSLTNHETSSEIYQTARDYRVVDLEKISALYLLKFYSLSLIPLSRMIAIEEETPFNLSNQSLEQAEDLQEQIIYSYLKQLIDSVLT